MGWQMVAQSVERSGNNTHCLSGQVQSHSQTLEQSLGVRLEVVWSHSQTLEREPGNEAGSDVVPFPGSWTLSAHIQESWNETRDGVSGGTYIDIWPVSPSV